MEKKSVVEALSEEKSPQTTYEASTATQEGDPKPTNRVLPSSLPLRGRSVETTRVWKPTVKSQTSTIYLHLVFSSKVWKKESIIKRDLKIHNVLCAGVPVRSGSEDSLSEYEAPKMGEPGVPGTRDLDYSIRQLKVRRQVCGLYPLISLILCKPFLHDL